MQSISTMPPLTIARSLAAGLIILSLGLAGCERDLREQSGPQVAGWSLIDASQRHPIMVSQQPQSMQVRVSAGSRGLDVRQRNDVLAFADRARASDSGNSRLVISAPGGGANEVAAMHAVSDIRQIVADHGFPESSIAIEAYHADDQRDPPIRVSYLRYIADGPECGNWPTNLANEPNNLPYMNFGCAAQHNLAAMVANPADLVGPRTESGRPAERRDAVWGKYLKGESSASQKSEDEKIQVAK